MKNPLAALFIPLITLAAAASAPERAVPARSLPTPTTVSPALQAVIAPAWPGAPDPTHYTTAQWKGYIRARNADREPFLRSLKQKFNVTVHEGTLAGVRVYRVIPDVIAEENRRRLLVHVHGGAYILYGGEVATTEAILMAHYGQIEVVSVDYRMPPDDPFPAALDDTVAVWREVIKGHTPLNVGLFGTSAGGGLVLATVIKLKALGLPLPGALMAGTPWSDLTKTGDTYYTHEYVDNVLGTNDGRLDAAARLYAGKHDLKEPLLSPVYGDLSGFPPTILLSGTRDLFLSNTVRVQQKLLQAGVTADLVVFEGESHAQYASAVEAPESAAAFREVAHFFNAHLDK
jgi:monoterpene epsilon-lactone hydrolase